jgi:hypothetical protein
MSLRNLLMIAALTCLGASAFAQVAKPGTISYRGKVYEASALPPETGPAVREAVDIWAGWAKTQGYRLDLDPSRRVLLVSAKGNTEPAMGWIGKTLALFDSLFPASVTPAPSSDVGAPPEPAVVARGVAQDPADVIPEDPETPPPGAPKTLAPTREDLAVVLPQSENFRPDSQLAVMLIAKNSADYVLALDQLAVTYPYLADWKKTAGEQIGFALGNPLCGAYNETSPGQEEWNPDNELVHRTMALLVLRRFSVQPYWLHTGLCWHAEMSINKSIYCMPYRDGFVGIGEHGGWVAELNSLFGGRSKQPLKVEEFAIVRGSWDSKRSKAALGMVEFLAKLNPRVLSGFLEELRLHREQNGRITNTDGSWVMNPKYEVPNESQRIVLEKYFGAKVLSAAIAYWTTGAISPVK